MRDSSTMTVGVDGGADVDADGADAEEEEVAAAAAGELDDSASVCVVVRNICLSCCIPCSIYVFLFSTR